jgi:hypothetical protein
MPLYLGPIVTRIESDGPTYAPPYGPGDDPRIGAILFGPPQSDAGKSLLWLPDPVSDPTLDLIGDSDKERPTVTTRDRVANAMGVNLKDQPSLAHVVAELLMDHGRTDGRGHIGIRDWPSIGRLRHEVWLGELGCIWFSAIPRPPSTASFTETWPSDGAITSGQDHTWAVTEGTPVVASNKYTNTGATGNSGSGSCTSSLFDTANQLHQADWTAIDAAVIWSIKCRDQGDSNNNDYRVQGRHQTGAHQRLLRKRVAGSNTDFFSDTNDPGASGLLKITVDGSTVTGYWGASGNSGAQTDASPSLTSNVRVAVTIGQAGATSDQTFDNNHWEDIVAASTWRGYIAPFGWK